jgi:hypothetical protein
LSAVVHHQSSSMYTNSTSSPSASFISCCLSPAAALPMSYFSVPASAPHYLILLFTRCRSSPVVVPH